MPARGHSRTARAHNAPPTGLALAIFHHPTSDVQAHVAPLQRLKRYHVVCRSQREASAELGLGQFGPVGVVLWELSPGRRPNWRRLRAIAGEIPIASHSADPAVSGAERSRALGFVTHLTTPVDVIDVAHQIALAAPGDMAARCRHVQRPLVRFLDRVPVLTQIARHVAAPFEPMPVAEALVGRAAAWLPAPHCGRWWVPTRAGRPRCWPPRVCRSIWKRR
jgi:hypothetical protein